MKNKEQRQTDNNSKPVTYSYTGESRTYKDGRGRTAHRTRTGQSCVWSSFWT